ncbi:hypothetical protein NPIL_294601 [Nephila pilipes]|uniref:Uncharacterized protein n=1 Tax=Nephila pilipes TaxID=299642 RepID=A0A8X6QJU3_NEPPI|nr:hypothetical protein NPIL_294601 [Nephila pilipes]
MPRRNLKYYIKSQFHIGGGESEHVERPGHINVQWFPWFLQNLLPDLLISKFRLYQQTTAVPPSSDMNDSREIMKTSIYCITDAYPYKESPNADSRSPTPASTTGVGGHFYGFPIRNHFHELVHKEHDTTQP